MEDKMEFVLRSTSLTDGFIESSQKIIYKSDDKCAKSHYIVKRNITNSGSQKNIRTSIELYPERIIWACFKHVIIQRYNLIREEFEPIDNLPPGPMIKKKNQFLKEWRDWVEMNEDHAKAWLLTTLGEPYKSTLNMALEAETKNEIELYWNQLADELNLNNVVWSTTWTGLASAPVKIATEIQREYRDLWDLYERDAFRWLGERPIYEEEEAIVIP